MRYHSGNAFDFITNIAEDKKPDSDMHSGYKVQEVLEASQISNDKGRWVDLPL